MQIVQEELIELPAGKLERGEDPAAAGMRELEEECGCKRASHSCGRNRLS